MRCGVAEERDAPRRRALLAVYLDAALVAGTIAAVTGRSGPAVLAALCAWCAWRVWHVPTITVHVRVERQAP